VKPHEYFERRGRDLWCEAPIAFTTAALGGAVEVPTLADGPEELSVPAGTQTGETLTLIGRGLPDLRTGVRGSQHVTVRVVTPTKLTPRQREVLEQFAAEGGDQIETKGWFARIRDALRGEES
jgi:molecular chaperone DnaJ